MGDFSEDILNQNAPFKKHRRTLSLPYTPKFADANDCELIQE